MKTKRLLAVILTFSMIISLVPVVSFAADTLEFVGSTGFISAPDGKYSKMAYKLNFNGGNIAEDAEVTVTKNGVTAEDAWFIDGEFIVKGGVEGTYTLNADYNGITATKTVNVIKTLTKSGQTSISGKLADASVFGVAWGTAEGVDSTTTTLANYPVYGSVTLDLTVNEAAADSDAFYYGSWSGFRFKTKADGAGYYKVEIGDYGKLYTYGTALPYNSDQSVKIVFDYDNKVYTNYINGNLFNSNLDLVNETYNLNSAFRFQKGNCVTGFTCFSGIECNAPEFDKVTITTPEKDILVPQGSGNKVQFKYEAEAKEVAEGGIKWSIVNPINGVSIDENTGILTVGEIADSALTESSKDISTGTVTIKATNGAKEATVNVNLVKICQDFEEYEAGVKPVGGGNGTVVAVETVEGGSNKYVADTNNDTHTFSGSAQSYTYANNGANIVAEFSAKRCNVNACNVYLNGMSSPQNWDNTTRLDTSGGLPYDSLWHNVKIVINPGSGTYRTYVDDKPIIVATALTNFDSSFEIKSLRFDVDMYYDDIKVYNVNNGTPIAINAALSDDAVPGQYITVTHGYTSYDGIAEDGTEVKWSISDKESGPYTEISGATTGTLEVTDAMDYKYLKATVTPKHKDLFDNSSYVSGESVEVITQIKSFDFSITYTQAASDEDTADEFDPNATAPTDGNRVVAVITAQKYVTGDKTLFIAIAKYSENGDLVEVAQGKTFELASGYNREQNLLIESAGGKIKLFIWDSETNRPYFMQVIK